MQEEMILPKQKPWLSSRVNAVILHEHFGLPLHHQTRVWYLMWLNIYSSLSYRLLSES
jgi:hypothetical protein